MTTAQRHWGLAAVAWFTLVSLAAAEPAAGLTPLGQVRPRNAREVSASNWSVGAETMDRDFTIYRHWKEYLGPLGAKKARLQSGWAKTEKTAGQYDWAWLDEIVNDMVAQGVEPWICICYGNTIYAGGGGTGLGGGLPKSQESLAAWDRYVTALVNRYKRHVDEWEIWNEPGLHGKKARLQEASLEYADFFIRTAKVVRAAQPKAKILGLSLPGMPLDFAKIVLERIQEQNAQGLLDELTYHPYNANPDKSYEVVEKLAALLKTYVPNATLRQGENGAPSIKGGFGAITNFDWDEAGQARWALRRLLGDLGRDIPSSYFSICDMKYPDRVNYKGLLAINPDQTVNHVKLAYRAVQSITAIFDNRISRVASFEGRVDGGPAEAKYALYAYRGPQGAALVTLWQSDRPAYEDVPATPVTVTLPGLRFSEPVWVDLASGRVCGIDKAAWSQQGDAAVFRGLPASGAAAVIAERSAIPFQAAAQ